MNHAASFCVCALGSQIGCVKGQRALVILDFDSIYSGRKRLHKHIGHRIYRRQSDIYGQDKKGLPSPGSRDTIYYIENGHNKLP